VTPEAADELARLLREWGRAGAPLVLTCAEDVFCELQEFPLPEEPEIQVLATGRYDPGQWKLTRHDSCLVLGGETIEQAVIVTHPFCAVIARNG
jgi:hypothetical protein